jgi:uncharacterized DUF497 family protein
MYEWDEAKNASNIAKHGVGFGLAWQIFNGPVLTAIDNRRNYGEQREISIGAVDGTVILTVVHTDRQGRMRIISARPASQRERNRYEQAIR